MDCSKASLHVFKAGDRCGENTVVRLLGTGGFAQVYEAIDSTGTRRALKVLDTHAEGRTKLKARLAQEGAALGMIEHMNVVRLYDAGVHEGRLFLLLELVEGQNLREARLARQPCQETLIRWIQQACEGIAAVHQQGILHRDLKPENILIGPQDVVKVIDFGIAKLSSWGVRTTHEQRLGTALYMSPEQIQGQPPDPRMDVYALGLMLYEALAGDHPIINKPATVFEICARQLNHVPPPLGSVAPTVPPELATIVDRAIQKDPALRLPTVRALSGALHQVLLGRSLHRSAVLRDILGGPSADEMSPEPFHPFSATPLAGTSSPTQSSSERPHLPAIAPSTHSPPRPPEPSAASYPQATHSNAVGAGSPAMAFPRPQTMAPLTKPSSAGQAHGAWRTGLVVAVAIVVGGGAGWWAMTQFIAWKAH